MDPCGKTNIAGKALDALPHPVIVVDSRFRVLLLNSEAGSLFDSPATDSGKPVCDLLQPGIRGGSIERDLTRALATGERIDFPYFHYGRKRWFKVSAIPDFSGGLVLSMWDASDMRNLEHELDAVERRVCDAFQNAAVGVSVADENGWILEANHAFIALTGYSLEELRGRDFVTITHPEDRDKHVKAGFYGLQNGDHTAVYEKRYVRKDGKIVWVRNNVSMISRPERQSKRYVLLCEDITFQRAAAEELRLSEARFRALTERSLDLITVIKADGTVMYESPAIEAMLGYTPEELLGRNAFEFVHPDDTPGLLSELSEKVNVDGVTARLVFRFRHKNNTWRHLECVCRNLLQDPAIGGIVVNSRDITERVETKRKLNEALE